jgi:imidazolonepropionase-like amidohydrolase
MDEETARMMAKNGIWLSIQPFSPDTPGAKEALGPEKFQKFLEMANGFPRTMDFVKKYDIKLAFGTDLSFTPAYNGRQANALAAFSRWLSNYELLKLITSQNAQYFELSGERHPYRQGPLGVIREGAYADILLVDGNPLDDVTILGDNGRNIPLIMKDGRIFKNTIQ